MPGRSGRGENDETQSFNGSVSMANNDGRLQLPIMVRPARKKQKPVWPFMEMWGLYRKPIPADGNCLFGALSDQLYDTPDKHDEIRQKIVKYLRLHRDDFEPFVPLDSGEDLVRSQPSTRSSRSRRVSVDEDRYEVYLKNMAQPTTWGGELEIRAFAEAFDRDIVIHRPTNAGQPFDQMVNNKRAAGQPRQFVHVAFGGEETRPHYESVRRVEATAPAAPTLDSTNVPLCGPAERDLSTSDYSTAPLKQLQQARPSLSSEEIHDFLERSRKQLDTTFSQIINLDRERSSSASSASRRSSSSKRSRDEDDDSDDRASKRALRRVSLRNRTRAFVTYVTPASSSNGTEISFKIRIDTPPGTPTKVPGVDSEVEKEEKPAAAEKVKKEEGGDGVVEKGKEANPGGKNLPEPAKVPDTTGKSSKAKEEAKVPNTTGTESKGEAGKRGGERVRGKSRSKSAV